MSPTKMTAANSGADQTVPFASKERSSRKKSINEINFLRLMTRCEQMVLSSPAPDFSHLETSIRVGKALLEEISLKLPKSVLDEYIQKLQIVASLYHPNKLATESSNTKRATAVETKARNYLQSGVRDQLFDENDSEPKSTLNRNSSFSQSEEERDDLFNEEDEEFLFRKYNQQHSMLHHLNELKVNDNLTKNKDKGTKGGILHKIVSKVASSSSASSNSQTSIKEHEDSKKRFRNILDKSDKSDVNAQNAMEIEDHMETQEKLLDEVSTLVAALRDYGEKTSKIIEQDTHFLESTEGVAASNLAKLQVVTKGISAQLTKSTSCTLSILLLLVSVSIVFVSMVFFMKVIPKSR